MARKKKETGAQFVRYFGPVLDALRELGGSGRPEEVVQRVAKNLNLSDTFQNELLESGQSRYRNQVHWARFYLVRDGPKRGVWSLTERGWDTHLSPDQAAEIFHNVDVSERSKSISAQNSEQSVEPLQDVTGNVLVDYKTHLIELMLGLPPSGFERLAQRLLREAGFTEVIVTGSSGDGGIDGYGTLQINPLVSLKVLFQCKRYTKSVSPSHVRDFRGAMAGRADKGIIITTGTFTTEARREATRDGVPPIELIDGERLVEMLEQLELGLTPVTTFQIDEAFFNEFRK